MISQQGGERLTPELTGEQLRLMMKGKLIASPVE
jgi:hypothetical protein